MSSAASFLPTALARHARERPDAPAAIDKRHQLTWAQLRTAVAQRAEILHAAGVQPGMAVAHCAADSVGSLVAALGTIAAGAVHAPIDHQQPPSQRAAMIARLGIAWQWDDIPADPQQPPTCSATGGQAAVLPGTGSARPPCFLRYSSGTTGRAKGVLLSAPTIHERVLAAAPALGLTAGDRVLWLLPMAYHFAVSILLYIEVGATTVFAAALRATTIARQAKEHAVTFAYLSPYHVARLTELPADQDLPPSLQTVVVTTAALERGAADAFRSRHGITVRQALGIIEVGLPLVSPGSPGEAPGELGAVGSTYEASVVDAEGRRHRRDGEGELCLRGPGMVDWYLDPLRDQAAILDEDGWFRTGDAAAIDGDLGIRLLGRLKDVINVGGVKVFPLEVETVIDAHPAVAACRVIRIADDRTGDAVGVEIQAATENPISNDSQREELTEELRTWCRERLAKLAQPATYHWVSELPMTGSGKVKRSET